MGKKVLVIGPGGREHTLTWKLAQSPQVRKIACAPGNAGTAMTDKCTNIEFEANDIKGLISFAEAWKPDLTVVGPEGPLCRPLGEGIVDRWPEGMAIFGPNTEMAQIEGYKPWAKHQMNTLGIPTAAWRDFPNASKAIEYIHLHSDEGWVVKSPYLCAGKGVKVCADRHTSIEAVKYIAEKFGGAGEGILIEKKLVGTEFSLLAICDGEKFVLLKPAKDYKPVGEGDTGENTGGMGCYCPATYLSDELIADIAARGIAPIVKALNYKGVLYLGGMLMPDGSWAVLEYNCRFGDPETQVILPLLKNDLFELLLAACNGELPSELAWHDGVCVSVVLCSGGYPGPYEKGKIITGLDKAQAVPGACIFHAGTTMNPEGAIITAGGRVINAGAVAPTFAAAQAIANLAAGEIDFDGMIRRHDIADEAVKAEALEAARTADTESTIRNHLLGQPAGDIMAAAQAGTMLDELTAAEPETPEGA